MSLEPDNTFSSISWQMALSCVNMSDFDISESPHVKKMMALSTTLLDEHGDYLRQLVFCIQLKKRSPCEAFRKVANKLIEDGMINWGRIVSLYAFARMFVQTLRESGQHSYKYVFYIKKNVATELYNYTITHLYPWITANGGWVS